ncbi:class I SAM-dependent methyltransferase [Streptomyces sp. NPDC049099]|uniref:class I SAM-dependent methyltransferase n=1 Tax=Streptomyces sp. NPDC049099 TaxID=3155768 RepID=UPI0034435D0E
MTEHGVRLGTVQETLLIPLYGRAVDSGKPDAILRDTWAEEIVAAIDYDFARFDNLPSLTGAVLRTSLFDRWVADFLATHPAGTVVEIGAGLNTRYERLDNGRTRWFDLDLPDVTDLRRTFFTDTPRRMAVAASVTDPAWTDTVTSQAAGPYFLAAEAVLPFLDEADVRQADDLLADRFAGSLLDLGHRRPRHRLHPGPARRAEQDGRPDAVVQHRPARARRVTARIVGARLTHPEQPAAAHVRHAARLAPGDARRARPAATTAGVGVPAQPRPAARDARLTVTAAGRRGWAPPARVTVS